MNPIGTKAAAAPTERKIAAQAHIKATREKMALNKAAAAAALAELKANNAAQLAAQADRDAEGDDDDEDQASPAQSKRWATPTPRAPLPPGPGNYEALVSCDLEAAETYLEAPMLTQTGLVNVIRNLIAAHRILSSQIDGLRKEFTFHQV
jgi:hypothetical protein